jgi:hypothetical protein
LYQIVVWFNFLFVVNILNDLFLLSFYHLFQNILITFIYIFFHVLFLYSLLVDIFRCLFATFSQNIYEFYRSILINLSDICILGNDLTLSLMICFHLSSKIHYYPLFLVDTALVSPHSCQHLVWIFLISYDIDATFSISIFNWSATISSCSCCAGEGKEKKHGMRTWLWAVQGQTHHTIQIVHNLYLLISWLWFRVERYMI